MDENYAQIYGVLKNQKDFLEKHEISDPKGSYEYVENTMRDLKKECDSIVSILKERANPKAGGSHKQRGKRRQHTRKQRK